MFEKDLANLEAILDAVQKIQQFSAAFEDPDTFYEDQKSFDACLMNFIVIGESVAKLSDTLRDRYPSIPWSKIKGFRNIVAHNYFGIDAEELWQTIQLSLPTFKSDIEKILEDNS